MIRFTIQRKVFLATFALAATMAVLLTGLSRWNLERGFGQYVVEAEIARLDWMVANLERAYARSGGWGFLAKSPEPWDRAVEQTSGDIARPPGPPRGPGLEGHPPGPPGSPGFEGGRPAAWRRTSPDMLGFRPRLSLRDPSGKVLAGRPDAPGPWATRPFASRVPPSACWPCGRLRPRTPSTGRSWPRRCAPSGCPASPRWSSPSWPPG